MHGTAFPRTDSRLASFSKMAKKQIVPSAISDLISGSNASSASSKHSIQDKQVDKRCLSSSGRTKGSLFSPTSSESTRFTKLPEYGYQDIEFPASGKFHNFLDNNLEDIGGSISTGENISMSSMGEISKRIRRRLDSSLAHPQKNKFSGDRENQCEL